LKRFILLFFALILSTNVFCLDSASQIKKTDSVPWLITYENFEKLIAESEASGDSDIIKNSYFANPETKCQGLFNQFVGLHNEVWAG